MTGSRPMSDHRQAIQEYMCACEALLKLDELSDEEANAVEEMFGRVANKFFDGMS